MKNRINFNSLFNHNRKMLYIILSIVMISVLTLTVVYAALSTTLNINGNAEVTAANWDIYFGNIQVNSASVTATTSPTISNGKTVNFDVTLSKPGDFYKFSVDIINDGTIDAMIDSVVKSPELTSEQAKYIKYEIEYSSGALINEKQFLGKNSSKTLTIEVKYRNDLTSGDLPSNVTTLNLSFTIVYTQAGDNFVNELGSDNSVVKIISGDLNTVGSEICIDTECFYVMSSDKNSVTMLAKYNLHVGHNYISDATTVPIESPTGIQDSTALGAIWDSQKNYIYPWIGTVHFSISNYWSTTVTEYPAYVYDSNSTYYTYINSYEEFLKTTYFNNNELIEVRIPKVEELISLGCSETLSTCKNAFEWVYTTTYRTGSAYSEDRVWYVSSGAYFGNSPYNSPYGAGVRPVIVLSK